MYNLALNKGITGTGSDIHRIVGYVANPTTILSNYANPDVNVNNLPASGGTADSKDGADTSLGRFETDLKNAPSNDNAWSTAWVFENDNLPQLKMVVDDGMNPPTFIDWPNNNQTDRPAKDYLTFLWADYAATFIANNGGGNGSSSDQPIHIATAEELAYFAQQVNAGGTTLTYGSAQTLTNADGFTGCYFALSADIDLKGERWEPIGSGNPFKGHFDGKGHKVKGLMVKVENNPSRINVGLFAYVSGGTLQNLGVELSGAGIEVSSKDRVYAGGIVGYILSGTLRNCYVEGTGAIKITSTKKDVSAGGIAGKALGLLTHCYATVDVAAEARSYCHTGGIVGEMYGTLSYTYATGKVTAAGNQRRVAGICGKYSKNNGNGELSHNLALNTSVSESGKAGRIHRIVGIVILTSPGPPLQSNYANPAMLLNGSPANSNDATSQDGADTYRETVRADLTGLPSHTATEWETVWDWTVYTSGGDSPLLRQVNEAPGGSLTYGDPLGGQTRNKAFSSLPSKPTPPPPPTPPTPPEPTPEPTVFYTVTLPSVEGTTTDPIAGTYEVESWSSFIFYLHLDQPNEQAQPIVTTDRGETLTPRTSDGAYVVKYVRSDITVMIDGIAVANETIAATATKVWATKGTLHISTAKAQTVEVYNLTGSLVKQADIPVGDTLWQLPAGIYIVRTDGARQKVIL